MRYSTFIGLLGAACLSAAAALDAQSATTSTASTPALVTGASGNMTPIVGSLEEGARFYAELTGLAETPRIRRRSHKDTPYPEVLKNQGTPNATIRQVNLGVPGSAWKLEVLEFTDVERQSTDVRPQDGGAVTLVLTVRDIDRLLATLTAGGHRVVTPGGRPVPVTTGDDGRVRAAVVKAPGGHFVELRQPERLPTASSTPPGNVVGGFVRVTVTDMDATLRLYRDRLGLRVQASPAMAGTPWPELLGLKGGRSRIARAEIPGTPQQVLEFVEFSGIDRTQTSRNIQDPGSTKIHLLVTDLPATITAFEAAGGRVVTTGGTFMIYNNVPTAIIRDLNNIFVNVQQAGPK